MVERTLRRKLNPKNKRRRFVQELKATSTTLPIKKYFYRNIRDVDFSIYSITLNKKRVYPHLIENKARVYNWVARMLLDQIDVTVADTQISLIISHRDSQEDLCLSAVDLFSWGVFRKYEKKNVDWYDVFRKKIRYENLYLK